MKRVWEVTGRSRGRWLVLGDGKLELPLVYIDDVDDAIMASVAKKLTHREVIQIIDPEHLTQDDVLGLAGGEKAILRVPPGIVDGCRARGRGTQLAAMVVLVAGVLGGGRGPDARPRWWRWSSWSRCRRGLGDRRARVRKMEQSATVQNGTNETLTH